ncbi:MAG TPA: dTDP-4-dehydrorhamnose reductase [Polyangiales bacterium]
MTLLIIGANGMLARALKEACIAQKRPFQGLDLPDFDLTAAEQVESEVRSDHSAVINCAAYTNVDGAEADEATAAKVNALGVRHLARACAHKGVPLVHYSTDYVFPGNAQSPYQVDELQAPLGAYGRTKAAGERAIWVAGGPHLILRTSWLYAPWANNFVRTIFKASSQKPALQVVNDQRGRPTSAEHLAKATLRLLDRKLRGTLHVTDGGECTWFEFAQEIVRLSGHPCQVDPTTSEAYARPAKRPAYSVLDLGPTEAALGPMPHWRDNLADVMRRLEPV